MCSVTNLVGVVYEQLTNGASMSSFIVSIAASWHIDTTSAPEYPSVCERMSRGSGLYGMKNAPKVQFQKCQPRGLRSSWIDEYVVFLLCPGDQVDQRKPTDPVALVS